MYTQNLPANYVAVLPCTLKLYDDKSEITFEI